MEKTLTLTKNEILWLIELLEANDGSPTGVSHDELVSKLEDAAFDRSPDIVSEYS